MSRRDALWYVVVLKAKRSLGGIGVGTRHDARHGPPVQAIADRAELLLEFCSGAAHDITTMLAALRFQLDAMLRTKSPRKRRELAATMDQTLSQAIERVGGIQDMKRTGGPLKRTPRK